MTTYSAILDSEIDQDSPITTSLMARLRNNPIASMEGASGAPRMNPRALSIGGSRVEGVLNNSFVWGASGFYDFDDAATISSAKTLPTASIIRIDGDFTLSAALTISDRGSAETGFDALMPVYGNDGDDTGSAAQTGGGGSRGAGGQAFSAGAGGAAKAWDAIQRILAARVPILGGNGGATTVAGAKGGGCIILQIAGDFDATGGTITADGASGAGADARGGGGGGTIIVVCSGTITAGTYNARGGGAGTRSGGSSGGGGGGGGGQVILVASAFAGTRTKTVTGGPNNGGSNPGSAGSSGASLEVTLTEAEINGLLSRL